MDDLEKRLENILREEFARDGHLDVQNFPNHSADQRCLHAMRLAYALNRDSEIQDAFDKGYRAAGGEIFPILNAECPDCGNPDPAKQQPETQYWEVAKEPHYRGYTLTGNTKCLCCGGTFQTKTARQRG